MNKKGLELAQKCAAANDPAWTDAALCALLHYAAIAKTPFTIEAAREWIGDLISSPKDSRAWGAVTSKALRLNLIRAVGYAPARTSHGAPKRTYRAN